MLEHAWQNVHSTPLEHTQIKKARGCCYTLVYLAALEWPPISFLYRASASSRPRNCLDRTGTHEKKKLQMHRNVHGSQQSYFGFCSHNRRIGMLCRAFADRPIVGPACRSLWYACCCGRRVTLRARSRLQGESHTLHEFFYFDLLGLGQDQVKIPVQMTMYMVSIAIYT